MIQEYRMSFGQTFKHIKTTSLDVFVFLLVGSLCKIVVQSAGGLFTQYNCCESGTSNVLSEKQN